MTTEVPDSLNGSLNSWAAIRARQPTGPVREDEPDKAAMREMAWEQQAGYRAEMRECLSRLGKGIGLYPPDSWEWVEPDWEANPETWPGVPKLIWLLSRVTVAQQRANFARYFQRPGYCQFCEDRPGTGWSQTPCIAHVDWRIYVKQFAADLFEGVRDDR